MDRKHSVSVGRHHQRQQDQGLWLCSLRPLIHSLPAGPCWLPQSEPRFRDSIATLPVSCLLSWRH